jgi:hypothetical protein
MPQSELLAHITTLKCCLGRLRFSYHFVAFDFLSFLKSVINVLLMTVYVQVYWQSESPWVKRAKTVSFSIFTKTLSG